MDEALFDVASIDSDKLWSDQHKFQNSTVSTGMVIFKNNLLIFLLIGFAKVLGQHDMEYPKDYYIPQSWPQHQVQLTEGGDLRELFEAGLRPQYRGENDRITLTLKHARISFVLPDGRKLPEFPVEYSTIKVVKSGILRIALVSQPLQIEEAADAMSKWRPFFSKERRRTGEDLSKFMGKVAADFSGYDDLSFGAAPEGFGGGFKSSNGVGFGVRFQKAFNEVVPVRMCLDVVWHYVRTKNERRDFFESQVPPPDGFTIATATNSGPDSTAEMMNAKGIPFPVGRGLGGSDSDVSEQQQKRSVESESQQKGAEQENPTSNSRERKVGLSWWYWSLSILGLALVVCLAGRKKDQSK